MKPVDGEKLAEIHQKVEKWLGLGAKVVPFDGDPEHCVSLEFRSPTEILLFKINLQWHKGEWRFGSRSRGLPVDVDALRTLIEPLQSGQKVDAGFQKD